MPVAERRTSSNAIFLFFSGLLMALTIFSFLPSFSRPNKLSFWAKNNSRKAQGIILTSHAAIGTFGLYLGNKLTEHEIITSDISTNLLFGLASVTTFLYPVRNVFTGLFKTSHKKQKLFSLLLTLSGFLLLVNVGNRSSAEKDFSPVTASLIYEMTAYEVVPGFSNQASNAVTYNNTNAPKYEPWEIVGNVLLTILALVGFLALLYIVAFFTCALACNGQEALSATVAITGGTLSVYLLIIAFKAIWKKNNNETTLESMKLPETV